jgi:hypothetical protein
MTGLRLQIRGSHTIRFSENTSGGHQRVTSRNRITTTYPSTTTTSTRMAALRP